MRSSLNHRQRSSSESAFTLIELLVSMVIVSLLLGAVLKNVVTFTQRTKDNQIISRANEVAREILDYMVFDIRVAGAGMPLGQSLFPMQTYTPASWATATPPPNWGSVTYPLGDAPWPILPGSDATSIFLRLNERGLETVLSAQYDPGAGLTMSVLDLNDFLVGDVIYLYDRRLAGNAGLRGLITARSPATNNVSGKTPGTITISSTNNVSMNGAAPYVFNAGSSVNRVSTLVYTSSSDWSGIRTAISDYDSTQRILYPSTQFSLVYKDRSGNTLTLPTLGSITTAADVSTVLTSLTDLGTIQITVTARGEHALSNGSTYQVSLTETVSLRNLLLSHY